MNAEIIRKVTKQKCRFADHFRNFDDLEVVQRIFGNETREVMLNLQLEFTNTTRYMQVTYEGHLLINPEYLTEGDLIDIYLDVIHEFVHVKQVLEGKNCNHLLKYVERPLEIQAYRVAVDEARKFGWNNTRILEYLDSDLVNNEELIQLAQKLELET